MLVIFKLVLCCCIGGWLVLSVLVSDGVVGVTCTRTTICRRCKEIDCDWYMVVLVVRDRNQNRK